MLREHLRREPANTSAYVALGLALLRMDEIPAAIETLDRAHYLRPGDPTVLYQYGLALETAGRLPEARLRYEAALRLDPLCDGARKQLSGLPADSGAPPRWLFETPEAKRPATASAPPPPRGPAEETREPAEGRGVPREEIPHNGPVEAPPPAARTAEPRKPQGRAEPAEPRRA